MKITVTVTAKYWTRNFRYRTRQSLARYWNFSFFVSEFVQVNPDNSLTECVNLYKKCTWKNITKSQDSQSFETVRALFVIFYSCHNFALALFESVLIFNQSEARNL